MSHAYFFTDHNRTLGPYGGCNPSTSYRWANSYQGLSEKISLVIGSLATQARVIRDATGTGGYISGIAAGNVFRTLLTF